MEPGSKSHLDGQMSKQTTYAALILAVPRVALDVCHIFVQYGRGALHFDSCTEAW